MKFRYASMQISPEQAAAATEIIGNPDAQPLLSFPLARPWKHVFMDGASIEKVIEFGNGYPKVACYFTPAGSREPVKFYAANHAVGINFPHSITAEDRGTTYIFSVFSWGQYPTPNHEYLLANDSTEFTPDSTSFKERFNKAVFYNARTPIDLINVLEFARKRSQRVRVYFGDQDTGEDWNEEHDTSGRIGMSMGPIRIPLLIHSKRSYGGPGLLDSCIVKVEYSNKKDGGVIWQHPKYHINPNRYDYRRWIVGDSEKVGIEEPCPICGAKWYENKTVSVPKEEDL